MSDDDEFMKFHSTENFVTINIAAIKGSFANIQYALFSTISSEEKNICSVKLFEIKIKDQNINKYFLKFISKNPSSEDEEKKIKEYRNIAYSYLCFAGIPIIIQSPYESLELSYFIDVSSSPFHKNPALGRIVYPENIENLDIVFNPNLKFYNKMGDCFAKVIDGLNPISNQYRVFFLHDINNNLKLLHHHPIANNKIPGYANLITKENFEKFIQDKKPFSELSVNNKMYKYIDKFNPKIFYSTSYVDIGLPEETMIAASTTSNCLFLNPDHGQIKYAQKAPYNNYLRPVLRFLFRSKDYDNSYQNMLSFTAALASSTNIIIPFTVPCYDIVKMLSLFVENSDKFFNEDNIITMKLKQNSSKKFQKNIIFFIDLQYEKGNRSTEFAADCEFEKIINTFSKMDVFVKLVNRFILCKSVKNLVSTIRNIEEKDLNTITSKPKNPDEREELISHYEEIIYGLTLFLDIPKK